MNPCFDMMIERLPTLLRKQVTRENLIMLEEQIIRALDFDLQFDGPLPFLERYQRVLNIDLESENQLFFKIGYSARKLLRHMMHKATFLSYRPSQIASTAILVAIDLNKGDTNGRPTTVPSTKSFDSSPIEKASESHIAFTNRGYSESKHVFNQMIHSEDSGSPSA